MKQAAFPTYDGANGGSIDGMDLRDYFAAKAMQALLKDVIAGASPDDTNVITALAVSAYFVADTMLEARDEK